MSNPRSKTDETTLGAWLRQLRKAQCLPLRTVAAAADMDSTLLSKIELGQRLPTEEQIRVLALYFGAPPDELEAKRIAERFLHEYGRTPAANRAAAIIRKETSYLSTDPGKEEVQLEGGLRVYPSAVKESSKPLVDKLRGGYYTDISIAKWLCNWAIRTSKDRVLEPSCGDGVFLQCIAEQLISLGREIRWITNQITGVEIVEVEAQKSRKRLEVLLGKRANLTVECSDFFEWLAVARSQPYDCCIGNPPFIRYHNFPEPSRTRAMALMQNLGLKPNKLTNIWVPFAVAATETLAVDGRLAFILPAELLQVSYAAQLRNYLSHNFAALKIYACNEMFFEEAEQEVVLLLADGKATQPGVDNKCSIALYETESLNDLLAITPEQGNGNGRPKIIHHQNEKWLKYFLSNYEISLMQELRQSRQVDNLSKFASINIGVVTGENDYFVLSQEDVEKRALEDYTLPLVGRTVQLRGAAIDKAELAELRKQGHRVLLFYITLKQAKTLSDAATRYIAQGEALEIHKGFKCSIRDPWYIVPSVWIPDCFFFRQIYDFPRVVLNNAGATSTDTIHRMKCNVPPEKLLPALYTHLTAASAEIEGRSYGGGVLELEPTEAERLLVPRILDGGLSVAEIDKLVREGRLDDVLKAHDKTILSNHMGLSAKDCDTLARIWRKLMNRRRSRGRRKAPPIYESNGGNPL